MTEQNPTHNGRNFAIGFFGSTLITLPSIILMLTETIDAKLSFWIISILIISATVAFIRRKKFIGIGILTGITAIPFLFVGSCFAVFSVS